MKVGLVLDNLRLPPVQALATAARLGVDGIQVYAVDGAFAPWHMTDDFRREIAGRAEALGLEFSALCADFGGHGFQDAHENAEKIEKTKRILELAQSLGTNILTTHVGIIPDTADDGVYDIMYKACQELEQMAVAMDGYLAIETGCETAARLAGFLGNFKSGRICVNYDPANLVMVTGDDPVAGVELLKDYIVHTHAKDGIRYGAVDPKLVYGYPGKKDMSHTEIAQMVTQGTYFREMPVGKGQVPFPEYIQKLKAVGYDGYLTIERESHGEMEAELKGTVAFLRELVKMND